MNQVKRTILGHKLNLNPHFMGVRPKARYKAASSSQLVYPIVDLRKYDNKILDQGQEGDCTAASSGGVWMYLQILKWRIANKGYTQNQLNEFIQSQLPVAMDMIYALELQADGDFGEDNGSTISTSQHVLSTFGAAYDDVWPNTGLGFEDSPSSLALAAAAMNKVTTMHIGDLKDVRTSHSEGYPCWLGCPVFGSFTNSLSVMESGVIPMPLPFEEMSGGHAMKTIGHNDSKRMLLIANSWGQQVGQHGYFEMPYDYFEAYCLGSAATARLKA